MKERLFYLLVIAGMLVFTSYEINAFTQHYALLEQQLGIVFARCK